MRSTDMNAKELQSENERLKKLLDDSQNQLAVVTANLERKDAELEQTQSQHAATTEQFTVSLAEKDRQVASLEKQIERLLLQIRGSRQERVDPDQLLLFSIEELRELADQLGKGDPRDDLIDDDASPKGPRKRKSRGRVGKLPEHLKREIIQLFPVCWQRAWRSQRGDLLLAGQ